MYYAPLMIEVILDATGADLTHSSTLETYGFGLRIAATVAPDIRAALI